MKKALMIVAMIGVIAMAGTAEAGTYTFDNGNGDSDFDIPANWNPETGFAATLPDLGGGDTFTLGANYSATQSDLYNIEFGLPGPGTATLIIDTTGTLTCEGMDARGDAQLTLNSGTVIMGAGVDDINHGNGFYWGTTANPMLCRIDINGGNLNNVGVSYFASAAGNTSVVVQTDGTVVLGDGLPHPVWAGQDYFVLAPGGDDSEATWQISGGSLTVNTGTERIGIGIETRGGGSADGGAATFEVIGTGPSAITWNGTTVVNGAGTNKGALAFTMDASGVTPITLNSSLNLANLPDLTLDLSALPAGVGNILLVDTTGGIAGTFNGLAEGASVGGGYTLTYLGGADNLDLELVGTSTGPGGVIPEPAGLGLIGLALLAVRKRRS